MAIALLYFVTGKFGIILGSVENTASLIWAPGGIALAAFLCFGFDVWPGVALGAAITTASSRLSIGPSMLMVAANVCEPLMGAFLLKQLDFRTTIFRVRDALSLILVGAVISPALWSFVGAVGIRWAGGTENVSFLLTWKTWWVGDFFGIIIITPLLTVLATERVSLLSRPRFFETLVFIGLIFGYGLLVMARQQPTSDARELPVAFGIFPLALWAAIRFEQIGNVLVTFAITFVTLTAYVVGHQISSGSTLEALISLQIYIAMAACTGLILAAATMESKRAMETAQRGEEKLLTANESLEQRVQARTLELEHGKRQLTEAQELAHVGSWEWDVPNDKITWSEELHRIYGINQGELTFAEFVNRVHPDDRILTITTLKEAAAQHACYDLTYRIVRPDGTVRYLHGRGSTQTDETGQLTKVFGTAQDVTTQKESECKLRRYFSEIQDLYNNAPCGYHSLDADSYFVEVNDTELRLLGYRREELISKKKFSELLTAESQRNFLAAFAKFRHGDNQQLELELIRKDGAIIPILANASPIRDDSGEVVRTRYSIVDLTERKKAEEERASARHAEFARAEAEGQARRSAFLSEATQILVSSLDYDEVLHRVARLAVPSVCDWCIIDLVGENGALQRVIAHRDPEVEKTANELMKKYPPSLESRGGAADVIRSGRSRLLTDMNEHMISLAGGRDPEYMDFLRSLHPASYMGVPMLVRGQAIGAINFISTETGHQFRSEDLTLAEELARRAALAVENARLYRLAREAVEVRDEFLSIASHELKTPITSLKLRLQMAQRSLAQNQAPNPEGLAKVFDISNAQVERLNSLIDDLLDVSRIQAGKLFLNPEEFELGTLVQEMVSRFSNDAMAARCPVQVIQSGPVVGKWDRTRCEQVLVNLFSNAIKYAPRNPIHISVESKGELARLTVRDFGPGIPKDKQERIFERYERVTNVRHTAGLGLGLFIVRQIIQAHHGRIWVESAPGAGCNFIVEMPLHYLPKEPSAPTVAPVPAQLAGG